MKMLISGGAVTPPSKRTQKENEVETGSEIKNARMSKKIEHLTLQVNLPKKRNLLLTQGKKIAKENL